MKHVYRAIILIFFLVGILACGKTQDLTPKEIRIGVLGPFSGASGETTGSYTREGASLAATEMNNAGGLIINGTVYSITLIFADDQGTPEAGISAARQLITQDKVNVIVGAPFSSVAIPVGALAEEQHIPLMSTMSTNPDTTKGRSYVFRVGFIDDVQGAAVANFAYRELTTTTAAVLFDETNSYNRGIAAVFQERFTQLGGEIIAYEGYPKGTVDFSAYLEPIVEAQPGVLFLPNFTEDVVLQAKQARAAGIESVFIGSDGWSGAKVSVIPELDGAFYSHHWHKGSTNAKSEAFVKRFESHYNKEPSNTAALTFDALELVFTAIQDKKSIEPTAIRDGIAAIRDYNGVSGPISYINGGDPEKQVVIMRVQPDTIEFYEMVSP